MRMLSYLYVSICLQSWLLTSIIKLPKFWCPGRPEEWRRGVPLGRRIHVPWHSRSFGCSQGGFVWFFGSKMVQNLSWILLNDVWKVGGSSLSENYVGKCWKNTKGSSFATLNRCWFYMSSVQNSRLVCSSGIILTKFEKRLIGDNHNPWGSIPPIIPTSILDLTNQPLHTI